MGVTVISALPGNALPAIPPVNGVADERASGGFAALLNSDLFSQIGIAVKPDGTLTTGKHNDKSTAENLADTSLLASLLGQPTGAESLPKNIAATVSTVDTTISTTAGIATAGNTAVGNTVADDRQINLDDRGGRAQPELPVANASPRQTGGAPEKLLDAAQNTVTGIRQQAANIAAAADADATPTPFAHHLAASSAAPTAAPPVADKTPSIATPLHSPVWPQQFGDKVVWLARNEQQTAQLNINPPQLGPVQVTVTLHGDQASIVFASPHTEVRQAIESAMPQLKEMLSAAGINLGQANVGPNLQQQPGNAPFGDANQARSANENAILPANEKGASTAGATVVQRGRGLVDLFA
ncbi:MAG: flagellar hook-length control protein FliK [Desulfobulbus sp.]|nr:flagellar hook-length control protein FliK [Desulfobulbus sp.]